MFCHFLTVGCKCYTTTSTFHPDVNVGHLIPKLFIYVFYNFVCRLAVFNFFFPHSARNPSAHYCLKYIIVFCSIKTSLKETVYPKIKKYIFDFSPVLFVSGGDVWKETAVFFFFWQKYLQIYVRIQPLQTLAVSS